MVDPPFSISITINPTSLKFGMNIPYVQLFDFMVGLLLQNKIWGWMEGGNKKLSYSFN